ncbi:substrate-binding periplasmic protein [Devosia faecipullorum]|uniref:substrate-binding periplasmic protein n=1 Tax=Devosia faecipullorum TaxID=2755039 RepID=UPI001AED597A|nr:transporter substrate-binding domain-containing protein [Devosia faecipullorum]
MVFALTATTANMAIAADVPAQGVSQRVDEIKARGSLRVAVLGEMPWLIENTAGEGEAFSGPSWVLANEYAKQLGVSLELVPVSHETKIPIIATGQVDVTIAPLSITAEREKVVDFAIYSKSSICLVGKASDPKLADVATVDDLNRDDITMAFFVGTAVEPWANGRLPNMQVRGVGGTGATAPIEELQSGRANVVPLDNTKWPELDKAVSGLTVFPADCLASQEMATPVGHAIDKNQPEFLAFLRAVAEEVQPLVTAEEIRVITGE